MGEDSPLEAWLARATETLGEAGATRVRQEIGRHTAQRMMHEGLSMNEAVEALGDPTAARLRFARIYLTEAEEALLRFESRVRGDNFPGSTRARAILRGVSACTIGLLLLFAFFPVPMSSAFSEISKMLLVIAFIVVAVHAYYALARWINEHLAPWLRRTTGYHHIWILPLARTIVYLPLAALGLMGAIDTVAPIIPGLWDAVKHDAAAVSLLLGVSAAMVFECARFSLHFMGRYIVLFRKVRRLERAGH